MSPKSSEWAGICTWTPMLHYLRRNLTCMLFGSHIKLEAEKIGRDCFVTDETQRLLSICFCQIRQMTAQTVATKRLSRHGMVLQLSYPFDYTKRHMKFKRNCLTTIAHKGFKRRNLKQKYISASLPGQKKKKDILPRIHITHESITYAAEPKSSDIFTAPNQVSIILRARGQNPNKKCFLIQVNGSTTLR